MNDLIFETEKRATAAAPFAQVEVHIEELVLHGFAPGDRHYIGEAVERELALIFSQRGVPRSMTQSMAVDEINGTPFRMQPSSNPSAIGRHVARSVYGGLDR